MDGAARSPLYLNGSGGSGGGFGVDVGLDRCGATGGQAGGLQDGNSVDAVGTGGVVFAAAGLGGVDVCVGSDGGVGALESELNHLFETFHRVQQADRWKTSGIGLGLALVKQVIERLGSSISVSNAENWVQFDLCLPISQNHRSSLKASQIPLAPPLKPK
ncbi:MAG: ATP-binding protein [Synechococcus sp.]